MIPVAVFSGSEQFRVHAVSVSLVRQTYPGLRVASSPTFPRILSRTGSTQYPELFCAGFGGVCPADCSGV